jgi:hypothetical protein
VYAVTDAGGGAQQLVRFNSANPSAVTVLGPTGASLAGLDFRPATGELYGFNGTQLFTIDLGTGAATPVGAVSSPVAASGGFDFNPTVDRIRMVDAAGTNLRVNPTNGVAIVDGPYTYAPGDVRTGAATFTAVAYTNSFAGSTATTLFGIDATGETLVRIAAPNGGNVNTVGNLGLGFTPAIAGFDIASVDGTNAAFLVAINGGAMTSSFYSVNLETGAATSLGVVSAPGGLRLQSIAVSTVPEPGTWMLLASGLAGLAVVARRRQGRTATS